MNKIESYFFRYAFPCAHLTLERGAITQEEYDELERRFLEDDPPSREILEKTYSVAFGFLKKLGEKMGGKDKWDPQVIKKYWKEGAHNEVIDKGEGYFSDKPEALKELCRIHTAKVIGKKDNLLIVKYGDNKTRVVFDSIVPDAKVGDIVTIHYAYAIEKVD